MIGQFSPTFQEFKTFRETRKERKKPKDGICETIYVTTVTYKILISITSGKALSLQTTLITK
ncbi:hypothetical protein LEP1GSC132_2388 [Leptospira kirschneri str. 200803703]|nr:hypothetical protein LEP1GSC132_2388 [Leptospira kirschneri str. 200803703]